MAKKRVRKSREDAQIDREIAEANAKHLVRQEKALKSVDATLKLVEKLEGVSQMAKILKRSSRFRSVRDLFDELDALWLMANLKHPWIQAGSRWVIINFLGSFLDHGGYRPATFFSDQFGIPPSRLRQAAKRGHLKSIKTGTTTMYSVADVEALWPSDAKVLEDDGRDKA